MGLSVSPVRTTWLFPGEPSPRIIACVLGTRRQTWLDGIGQQLSGQADEQPSEPMERMDPTTLAARIGMRPKSERPTAGAEPTKDGIAPWRKALRKT